MTQSAKIEENAAATDAILFKAGDPVIYRNDYSVEFQRRVTGHYLPKGDCPLYARGYRYLLNNDSHWMPVKEENLRIDSARLQEDLILQYGPTMRPFAATELSK